MLSSTLGSHRLHPYSLKVGGNADRGWHHKKVLLLMGFELTNLMYFLLLSH